MEMLTLSEEEEEGGADGDINFRGWLKRNTAGIKTGIPAGARQTETSRW